MTYIYDLSLAALGAALSAIGAERFRAGQIYTALHQGVAVADISNIAKTLRTWLQTNFACDLPAIVTVKQSQDGTKKYLLAFQTETGRDLIECVFLPQDYGNTVCVSTQVGCRMGCKFCASGKNGLVRNLTAGEILAQVILVNKLNASAKGRGVTNIVLMGSGEPLDNYDNVMQFFALVTSKEGLNISARNISLSTSGLVPQIKQFADAGNQVNLCISLHAPNDTLRRQIMPVAQRYTVQELVDAAKYFFNKTHRRVIFEYSLMLKDGVPFNCGEAQARELAQLVRGFPAHINLINLNPLHFLKNATLTPPSREIAKKFMDTVIKSGVSCTMRRNRGDDIDGACGQLRLQHAQ